MNETLEECPPPNSDLERSRSPSLADYVRGPK
jgi:hypothetical protein